jgi:His-Xaa-Ser system protein HxsD
VSDPTHPPDSAHVVSVDLRLFSLTSVRKTAYRFTDRFGVDIGLDGTERAVVRLTPKPDTPDAPTVADEFRNELLDQDLRERVYVETEPFRRVLLAHALSKVPVVDAGLDTAAYEDDPALEQ